MNELNEKKSLLLKSYRNYMIGAFICTILGIFFLFPLLIIGIVLFILMALKADKIKKLDFEFKGEIMNGLANKYFEDASYIPGGYISKDEYKESENTSTGDNFVCRDTIKGRLGKTKFDVSDIYVTETHNNGKNTYTVTLFNGLFARIDSGHSEKGKVKISEVNKKGFFDGYQKVKFESIDFNNKFNCLTTDEHLAFYLTNPRMMEVLLDLERRYQGNFYLLYKDGLLYLLIDGVKIDFDVKLTEMYSEKLIDEYKQNLMNIKSIIEAL